MVQATKTEETKFEELKEERIQLINDDWSIPLETFRKYQEANLSLNMYFVDSPLMFSYAWCVGAQTVTTGNCRLLSSLTTNPLYDVSRRSIAPLILSSFRTEHEKIGRKEMSFHCIMDWYLANKMFVAPNDTICCNFDSLIPIILRQN